MEKIFDLLKFSCIKSYFLFDNYIIVTIVVVLYFFLFLPLYFLGFGLHQAYVFDEDLNREQFPKEYQKGLYLLTEEDKLQLQLIKQQKKVGKRKRSTNKRASFTF